MTIHKCKYFNDHHTVCTLMLDDLVPVAVTADGKLGAHNDWGYLMDQQKSLYTYMDKWLFQKYPEIRGTIFLPLESQHSMSLKSGYTVFSRDFDIEWLNFLHKLQDRFEFAFHGLKHSWKNDQTGKTVLEYEHCDEPYLEKTKNNVRQFEHLSGIRFKGGKFPGYKNDSIAAVLPSMLGSKWWALDASMIQRVAQNDLIYDSMDSIIHIPTNICGDTFGKLTKASYLRKVNRRLKNRFADRPQTFIDYLYDNRLPLTVQEHFQNAGTDGKRQTPNLYDDLSSLDQIFGFLRKKDVWYANCTEMAHYFDSYNKIKIFQIDHKSFKVSYEGLFENPLISVSADFPSIVMIEENIVISGHLKNGSYLFSIDKNGTYEIIC